MVTVVTGIDGPNVVTSGADVVDGTAEVVASWLMSKEDEVSASG